MAGSLISPVVNQDVVAMWNAPDADSTETAKQALIKEAKAELETIPADDVADQQTLNNIIAYANGYQFDSGAPKDISLDSDDLNLALANAFNESGPDLVSLFQDYMTLLNKERQSGIDEVVTDTVKQGVQMSATYTDSMNAATDEQSAALTNGIGSIVSGTLQVAGGLAEGVGVVKASGKHAEVETITNDEMNDSDEIDPQTNKPKPGLRSQKKTSGDNLDDLQSKLADTEDAAKNGVTQSERQTAQGKLKQANEDVLKARATNRDVDAKLDSANTKITAAKAKAETYTNMGHVASTVLSGLGQTVSGTTTIVASYKELKSKGEQAASTLDSNTQQSFRQAGDATQSHCDEVKGSIEACQQNVQQVMSARNQMHQTVSSNSGKS